MNLRSLREYLSLVPEGIKNHKKIIKAIITKTQMEKGNLPEDQVNEIIRRRIICSTCPFMSTNAVKAGTYKTERTDKHCVLCGCPIENKTACLDCNCGVEYYNKEHPETPMELKWRSYDINKNKAV